jgi:hypothetical protein
VNVPEALKRSGSNNARLVGAEMYKHVNWISNFTHAISMNRSPSSLLLTRVKPYTRGTPASGRDLDGFHSDRNIKSRDLRFLTICRERATVNLLQNYVVMWKTQLNAEPGGLLRGRI